MEFSWKEKMPTWWKFARILLKATFLIALLLIWQSTMWQTNNINQKQDAQIVFDLCYDVPPVEDKFYAYLSQNGKTQKILGNSKVPSGTYSVTIEKPGFYVSTAKTITIYAGESFIFRETLLAKPRKISFTFIYAKSCCLVKALEVMVNGTVISQKDVFQPGKEYWFTVKFEEYRTTHKSVYMPPGDGFFNLPLQSLGTWCCQS